MIEIVGAFAGRYGGEEAADRLPEFLLSACRCLTQQRLEPDGQLLDRVEIGAVGRQVEERGPRRRDRPAPALDLVRREVVEHHALIREGMANTSVTCVLAGAYTWQRRWVRYEIGRSIVKGNGLLTVKIHNLQNLDGYLSNEGPNPLDHMGVYRVPDGRMLLAETNAQGQWIRYEDYTQAVSLPAGWEQPATTAPIPLSRYARLYDYTLDGGCENFGSWAATAAMEAAR